MNAEGCYNNRKTGYYHCHRAASAPAEFSGPMEVEGAALTMPIVQLRGQRGLLQFTEASPAKRLIWTGIMTV